MPLSDALIQPVFEILLTLGAHVGIAGGILWFLLFVGTLGFDPPWAVRLVRRWAGALCLCAFSFFSTLAVGLGIVSALDLAVLPVLGAVAYTLKTHDAPKRSALRDRSAAA